MTPVELFTFALNMRSNVSNVAHRVEMMIEQMSLQECRDTLYGDEKIKGLSGGEKKRTSIGYELITEPQVLLLDEPTSGLDSATASKIINMLKRDA
jgi:ABC-type multidrug transport system ATPase subunit